MFYDALVTRGSMLAHLKYNGMIFHWITCYILKAKLLYYLLEVKGHKGFTQYHWHYHLSFSHGMKEKLFLYEKIICNQNNDIFKEFLEGIPIEFIVPI